ncbi:MAG: orotidine-5'-phosphate decarboxylase [Bacilli bacterium]|nr:orotidine-5'-phosphate decarboxylase [Bacilli bacterium]
MNKDVIIALDFDNKEETLKFLSDFKEQLYVKVGMELFYGEGPDIIKELKSKGHKIFLDLKLHDIPTTVKKAMINIAKLNIDMVNVHAAGGLEMMAEALAGLEEGARLTNKNRPLCIGVTQLTSTSQEILSEQLLINKNINEVILQYAKLVKKAGLDGVICSPLESQMIHQEIGPDFLTVTPGIRLLDDNNNDQKRVATPRLARDLGSDYIVVGRSITKADNPQKVYNMIKTQFISEDD